MEVLEDGPQYGEAFVQQVISVADVEAKVLQNGRQHQHTGLCSQHKPNYTVFYLEGSLYNGALLKIKRNCVVLAHSSDHIKVNFLIIEQQSATLPLFGMNLDYTKAALTAVSC